MRKRYPLTLFYLLFCCSVWYSLPLYFFADDCKKKIISLVSIVPPSWRLNFNFKELIGGGGYFFEVFYFEFFVYIIVCKVLEQFKA